MALAAPGNGLAADFALVFDTVEESQRLGPKSACVRACGVQGTSLGHENLAGEQARSVHGARRFQAQGLLLGGIQVIPLEGLLTLAQPIVRATGVKPPPRRCSAYQGYDQDRPETTEFAHFTGFSTSN